MTTRKTTKTAATAKAAKAEKVEKAEKVAKAAATAKVAKAAATAATAKTAAKAAAKTAETVKTATKAAATAKVATKAAASAKAAKDVKAAAAAKDAKTEKAVEAVKPAKAEKAAADAKPAKAEKPAEAAKPAKAAKAEKTATPSKAVKTAKTATAAKPAEEPAKAAKPAKKEPAKAEEPKPAKASAKKEPAKVEEPKPAEKPAKVAEPEPEVKAEKPAEQPAKEPEAPAAEAPAAAEQAVEEAAAAIAEAVEEAAEAPVVDLPDFSGVGGVLIAAAECAPLVKVGGLADVVGALPKYLKKLGIDARVIMPFHRQIKERYYAETQHLCDFQASLGWRSQYVGLEKLEIDGTIYYFIDNEFYFGGPIYCGGEFEGEQYAFFTRAVMDAIPQLDFDVRILHCNDWHTAMMPLLARTQYQGGMQAGLRTVLTIHNLHFQGQFSHEFDRDLLGVDDSLATPQFVEHYGCDNMLKAGIVFADKVTTVSPTYSQEICGPEQGERLDGVLRSRGGDLWGILNGIDVDLWNPQTDEALPSRYSVKSLWRKAKNREALLEELGLEPAGENTAVIGMVGRLTPQKGIDLVQCVLDDIMYEDVRVIILGSGDSEYEDFLRDAENRHKGRLCSYIGYNGDLSHRIYAGCDLFLMPSLFEPCGISQMISMRYGTLPIVRETGGLKDTVFPYNEFTGEGNGFSFSNYNAHEMLGVIRWALSVWRNPDVRKRLMTQAMESDFSFDRCARAYAELYRTL